MFQNLRAAAVLSWINLKNSQVRAWMLVSLGLTLIAASCSYTFHHFDEQYQILEFASFKLGKTPEAALRWEYPAAMRGWLQPWVYYQLARAFSFIGIENPFFWAFSYRLLSGVLTWLGLCWLYLENQDLFDDRMRRWALRLMALLWFIPYLAVRTSGETFTTIFLLGSLALASRYRRLSSIAPYTASRPLISFGLGALLSFSVLVRFPSAVFAVGIFAWLGWVQRAPWKDLLVVLLGAIPPLVLSIFVDRWGYGYWTFPMWNYLNENLLLGKSQAFGTSPFFAYLYLPSINPMLLLTIPLTLAAITACWRWPYHVFTWTVVPYVLVHSCLAHKESRFLFPIAMLLPFLVPMAAAVSNIKSEPGLRPGPRLIEKLSEWFNQLPRTRFFKVLVVINLLALVYLSTCTTRKEMALQKRIYSLSPYHAAVAILGTPHPFQSAGMEAYFYRPHGLRLLNMANAQDLETHIENWCIEKESQPFLSPILHVLTRGGEASPAISKLAHCRPYFESLPEFYLRENPLRIEKNAPVWRAYACTKESCR